MAAPLFGPSPPPGDGPTGHRPFSRDFHLMTKPTGAICNLDCDYCFFLTKEQLYPGSAFRMDLALHERYLTGLFEAQRGLDEVTVAYQGGEPTLMGLDFFRQSVELQRRLAVPGQRVVMTIQTNGTLLDDEWGEFLAEHDVLVGISIDGPRQLHDAYRVDKGGKPTFDRVMRGLDVLRRHDVEWNALTTVNAANGDHGATVYRFLRDDCGARFIQFIPVVERVANGAGMPSGRQGAAGHRQLYVQSGTAVSERSVTGAQYGRFLVEVFDEWVRRDVGDVFVQMFDTALAHWLGMEQVGLCVHARTCGASLALEHNGDLYSCDHCVEPEHLIGNIRDTPLLDLVTGDRQVTFGNAKLDTLPGQCRSCDVRFACNGGCPKDRFVTTATGEPGPSTGSGTLNHLCDGYLAFFRHVDVPMRFMAGLIREGEDAAGVMEWYRRHDAVLRREGPVPDDLASRTQVPAGAPGGEHR